jgi:hypothetical protein
VRLWTPSTSPQGSVVQGELTTDGELVLPIPAGYKTGWHMIYYKT